MKKNIILLSIVHFSNYLFPLLVLPYQIRVLSVESYATLAQVQAIILTLSLLINFGFNLTSTKKIACSNDSYHINKIYTETILAKVILLFFTYVILFIMIMAPQYSHLKEPLLYGSISFFGYVFYASWLYQGLEKLKGVVIATTIAKSLSIMLTFIFVRDNDDIIAAVITQNLGVFISGLISIAYVHKFKLAKIIFVSLNDVLSLIKESFPLFLSFSATSIYTYLNVIFLSFFCSSTDVANFAAADKLRMALQGVLIPISQAVFPKVNKCNDAYKEETIKKYGFRFLILSITISIVILIFGKSILSLYFGEKYSDAGIYFTLLFIMPVIISASIILSQWFLVTYGYQSYISKIYMLTAIFHIGYALLLTYFYDVYGMILSIILTESIIVVLMYKKVKSCIFS
ncbi:flippase [Photobacterium damselae]